MSTTNSSKPYAELSAILNRKVASIFRRYNSLSNQNNTKSGQFSLEESCLIMKTVWERGEENLLEVFKDLEKSMKRPHLIIQAHYLQKLEQLIKMNESGTLDVDYNKILYQYLVDNNIKYLHDANWSEISK